jgi:3-hydroxybutyryl-CoA dehydrogenase
MTVAVFANDIQWEEITFQAAPISWRRLHSTNSRLPEAAAYFILDKTNNFDFGITEIPVFVNSINCSLNELNAPANVLRINGWNGFLKNSSWEIAGKMSTAAKQLMELTGKQYNTVPDMPGMVSPRILSMIINEACFVLGEGISSKGEIDTAMKLGTNYPYGPFEWAEKIGIQHIFSLLQVLSTADKRYMPAPLLQKETTTWH